LAVAGGVTTRGTGGGAAGGVTTRGTGVAGGGVTTAGGFSRAGGVLHAAHPLTSRTARRALVERTGAFKGPFPSSLRCRCLPLPSGASRLPS
jgi:hypothetical protein